MKSGLEGRNNHDLAVTFLGYPPHGVSMKSGLEGRNNGLRGVLEARHDLVSMKSGLEGRNNTAALRKSAGWVGSLNEVRPRRPEQYEGGLSEFVSKLMVSMKSGLEGRNNLIC